MSTDRTGLRLITWNAANRSSRIDEQVRALRFRRPDLVCLQEVRAATAPLYAERLREIGLPNAVDSFALARSRRVLNGPRQYGELIASRWPLHPLPPYAARIPWPEKFLSAVIATPRSPIELHTAHVPPGASNGWKKVEVLEGIYRRLARSSEIPRILCGDFNAPQFEDPNGQIVTWGQTIDRSTGEPVVWGSWNGDVGERWDAAERNVLAGLAKFDLADAYRKVNGGSRVEFSWYLKRRHRTIGRRFDHVFASSRLRPFGCRYLHRLRELGLSDHSALEFDFALKR